jgi:hypothetical protein
MMGAHEESARQHYGGNTESNDIIKTKRDKENIMKAQKRTIKAAETGAIRQDLRIAFVKGVSFLALVLGLVLTRVASAADPNLVGWWKLDEGQGQTAYDSAGSNDGTIYGATWTTGKLGGALEFDGDGDYVNTNDAFNYNALTVSAWVYIATNPNAYRAVVSNDDGSNGFYLGIQPGGYWISYLRASGARGGLTTSIDVGKWTHLVLTWDGTTHTFYRNGVFVDDEVDSPGTMTADVYIGDSPGYANNIDGAIDDVRIFDRALSEEEIQAVMLGSELLLPGFRAPMLDEPASPDDFVGGGSSGPGPSTDDPEIKELARALKYDPGLMYKFVHDYIQFDLSWGDVKGPYMTWMDRSGNGFDQASLMVALLEEAEEHCTEYTVADPNYVVGEIQLSATQAYEWLNMWDVDQAENVLARAGLYASVSEDPNDDPIINLEHVWVTVTIIDTGGRHGIRSRGLLSRCEPGRHPGK